MVWIGRKPVILRVTYHHGYVQIYESGRTASAIRHSWLQDRSRVIDGSYFARLRRPHAAR